jgi:hypothetical protein
MKFILISMCDRCGKKVVLDSQTKRQQNNDIPRVITRETELKWDHSVNLYLCEACRTALENLRISNSLALDMWKNGEDIQPEYPKPDSDYD